MTAAQILITVIVILVIVNMQRRNQDEWYRRHVEKMRRRDHP